MLTPLSGPIDGVGANPLPFLSSGGLNKMLNLPGLRSNSGNCKMHYGKVLLGDFREIL